MRTFALLICLFALFIDSAAQANSVTTMNPVMEVGKRKISRLMAQDMNIMRVEYDLVFQGREKASYRDFYKGRDYVINAFGDFRHVKGLTLRISRRNTSGEWVTVRSDNSSSSEGKISFSPSESAQYKITVYGSAFQESFIAGHYGVIIYSL